MVAWIPVLTIRAANYSTNQKLTVARDLNNEVS